MAININKGYLFLLDNYAQTFMPTQVQMDEESVGAMAYLEKNIRKCVKNAAARPGVFASYSLMAKEFEFYRNKTTSLIDLAQYIATTLYDKKDQYEIFKRSDLFICEVEIDEVDFLVGLEVYCKEEMVHRVNQTGKGIRNDLITNIAVLPNVTANNSNFFMINLDTKKLTILEKTYITEDEDVNLYADKILGCNTDLSVKEGVKIARHIKNEIINKHKLDKLTVNVLFERKLTEMINNGDDINMKEIAEGVFYEHPEALNAYTKEIEEFGVKKPISNENRVKIPQKKTQKIKTDTGIEIAVPLDYYDSKDYIEVLNGEDGRISIQIKNVGNLKN